LPGERKWAGKEMERKMKGYKELREQLEVVRKRVKEQKFKRENGLEERVHVCFYKSPVGTRTIKSPGGFFHSEAVGRSSHFSSLRK